MKRSFTYLLRICILLVVIAGLLSACDTVTTSTGSITAHGGTATQTALSPKEQLQQSLQAMNSLRSFHVDYEQAPSAKIGSISPSSSLFGILQPYGGIAGVQYGAYKGSEDIASATLHHVYIQEVMLDQRAAHSGQPYQQDDIHTADDLYVYHNNQWYVIALANLPANNDAFQAYGAPQITTLLTLAGKEGQLTDQGNTNLQGQQLHHITATFNHQGFQDIQPALLSTTIGEPALTDGEVHIDFYIDDSTHYLHTLSIHETTNAVGDTVNITTALRCSQFNQPISVSQPNNAQRISNLEQLPPMPS